MKRYNFLLLILALICCSASCKKDPKPKIDDEGVDRSHVYLSDEYQNKLKDSIWYYYKMYSLWEEFVPPSTAEFNRLSEDSTIKIIRNRYAQYFENGDDVLSYLMDRTKVNNPNRKPEKNYDWYSFLDGEGSVASSLNGQATSKAFGMSVFYLQTDANSDNADLYIREIDPNSAAYDAGLQRGDRIISLNDDTKIDYNYQKKNNFKTLNEYLYGYTLKIKVQKPNNNIIEKNITYKAVSTSPIILSKVIPYNGKKVGYLVYNSFELINYQLYNVFESFDNAGIDELIIDLRYNGGGYVETSEFFADYIAPQAVNGRLMYTYAVNKLLVDEGFTANGQEFGPIYFNKRGNLKLSRVYFLVSSATASASELLINNLKPHITTHVIGTYAVDDNGKQVAENTYGKPCGFFAIDLMNKRIDMYAVSFKMYNSRGDGDYFEGLKPNAHVWEFDSFYDYGDTRESMLASALAHISTGSFIAAARKSASVKSNASKAIEKMQNFGSLSRKNVHKGMFKTKNSNLKIK